MLEPVPDLANPDLANPDLANPDLANPDLANRISQTLPCSIRASPALQENSGKSCCAVPFLA